MPELPEVETIRRGLNKLSSQTVLKDFTKVSPYCFHDSENLLANSLNGSEPLTLSQFVRQGKYLIAEIKQCEQIAFLIIFHLRMTGKLIVTDTVIDWPKHTHFYFTLEDKARATHYLYFNDIRRFGGAVVLTKEQIKAYSSLTKLAFDAYTYKLAYTSSPLKESDALACFQNNLVKHPKTPIKSLLLDQTVIAGLGNIYADELLFINQIHPLSLVSYLSFEQISKLFYSIKPLLTQAIGHHGSTFSDYVDSLGHKGTFQLELKVYKRSKQACSICQTEICKIKIAGRSSHFCPKCQAYYGPKLN